MTAFKTINLPVQYSRVLPSYITNACHIFSLETSCETPSYSLDEWLLPWAASWESHTTWTHRLCVVLQPALMPAVFAVSSSKGGDSIISWGSLCQCLTILTVSLDSPGHRRAQSVVLILSHQVFAHADWIPLSLPFLQAALLQVHSMQQMFLSLNLLCSP